MKTFATLFLFVAAAVAQTLQINTPSNAVVCEPTLFTWSGGTPPYFLSILPGNQPGATALEDLGQQNGTSFTWNTDIAAGTSIGLTLRDSTGATAQSAAFTINPGTSTSCIGGSSHGSGSSSTGAGGSPASSAPASTAPGSSSAAPATSKPVVTTSTPSSAPAPTSTAPSSSPTTKPATSSTSSSAAAATTTKTGGALANAANVGVVAAAGIAAMAILA